MAQQRRLGEFVGGMRQKPNTLVRTRDAVASLPRRHMRSVIGPAGMAEDASDASSTSPMSPYVSDLRLCTFA
jgi:L,D-peptidoglycan transpeptidase YkuD (ErfK/YbiS/YcfS/YnhG family)